LFNILVVEDEKAVNDLITMNISLVGYNYDKAYDGKTALEKIKQNKYHLILLDIMLPELDGFELASLVKSRGIPIIFITAKDSLSDKIKGFDIGAEDYITKPFEMLELLARVKVVIRNKYKEQIFVIENVTINLNERTVKKNDNEITLTKIEFDLLEILAENKNVALSRDILLEKVWGYDSECETRTVDVYIQRLRKKLNWEDKIKTIYKIGYRLEVL